MGSPLLVSSDKPQPWALVIYLVFVVLPAYGVARLRLWRWLALAAATGVLAWTFLIFILDGTDALPAMVHLVVQAGLAAFFLVAAPYRDAADNDAETDWAASGVLFAFALAGIAISGSVIAGDGRPVFIAALVLILLTTGLRFAPAAPAAASAALTVAGALLVWPIRARDRRSARTSFLPERRCLRRPAPCARRPISPSRCWRPPPSPARRCFAS